MERQEPPIGTRARGWTRREVLAAAGAAALSACAARGGARRPAGARDAPRALPLVYDERGGLFVDARVAGRPARLILDTGASRSTISREHARALGLATAPGETIEGSAGVVASESAAAELEVPGLGPFEVDFAVYDFGSYDPACVGIAGHELLSRAPFRIDYGARLLEWGAPAPPRTIAMDVADRIPRIRAHANGVQLPFRLDTGATFPPTPEAYLNVTGAQARALGLAGEPAKVFTATGTGGATLELPVHRLDSLAVAGRALEPAWAIVQPAVGYFARADAVGFLGNSVLEKLDPWLDYAGGRFGVSAPAEPAR